MIYYIHIFTHKTRNYATILLNEHAGLSQKDKARQSRQCLTLWTPSACDQCAEHLLRTMGKRCNAWLILLQRLHIELLAEADSVYTQKIPYHLDAHLLWI